MDLLNQFLKEVPDVHRLGTCPKPFPQADTAPQLRQYHAREAIMTGHNRKHLGELFSLCTAQAEAL